MGQNAIIRSKTMPEISIDQALKDLIRDEAIRFGLAVNATREDVINAHIDAFIINTRVEVYMNWNPLSDKGLEGEAETYASKIEGGINVGFASAIRARLKLATDAPVIDIVQACLRKGSD